MLVYIGIFSILIIFCWFLCIFSIFSILYFVFVFCSLGYLVF